MDLKEAVQIETCKDYETDLQDAYYQLSMRYKRLKATVDSWDKQDLITSPESTRSIYDIQLEAMKVYLAMLYARGVMEGIELKEV